MTKSNICMLWGLENICHAMDIDSTSLTWRAYHLLMVEWFADSGDTLIIGMWTGDRTFVLLLDKFLGNCDYLHNEDISLRIS